MLTTGWKGKIIFFGIGMFISLAMIFLTGANSAPQVGRYQMQCVERGGFADVYVMDTTNGVVKWLDSKDEGKPFDEIKKK